MNERQNLAWDVLSEYPAERVLKFITDYHGMQIFDDGFIEHLVDEGVLESFIDDDEQEEL